MINTHVYACILSLSLAALMFVGCGNDDRRGPEELPATGAPHDSSGTRTPARSVDTIPESQRKYDVRSGIVEYRNSDGDVVQTLYFDDYGTREALYTVPGPGHDSTGWPFNVLVHADGIRYGYNPGAPSGRSSHIETGFDALLGTVPYVSGDPKHVSGVKGVKELGEKEILGKMAVGYSYSAYGEKITVWSWNRIPLSIRVSWGDEDPESPPQTVEATSVQVEVEIPAEKLTVPAEVNFQNPT